MSHNIKDTDDGVSSMLFISDISSMKLSVAVVQHVGIILFVTEDVGTVVPLWF